MHEVVIIATRLELDPFIQRFSPEQTDFGYRLHREGIQLDILVAGIGTPCLMLELADYLRRHQPDRAWHLGFAGSFLPDLIPGMLVEVTADCFADLGMDENGVFKPLHVFFPGLKGSDTRFETEPLTVLPARRGITVNTTSGSQERVQLMREHWQPDVESMEGAASMMVCRKYAIPCTQVRAISNFTGPRASGRWDTKLAAERLSEWLTEYWNTMW